MPSAAMRLDFLAAFARPFSRLLAVHHADVGHFTQFLDISSSKCHGYILLYLLFRKNARRTRRASGFQ